MEPIENNNTSDCKVLEVLEYLDTKGEHVSGYVFTVKPNIPDEIKLDTNLFPGKTFVSAEALAAWAASLGAPKVDPAEEVEVVANTPEDTGSEPPSTEQQPDNTPDSEVADIVHDGQVATEEQDTPAVVDTATASEESN